MEINVRTSVLVLAIIWMSLTIVPQSSAFETKDGSQIDDVVARKAVLLDRHGNVIRDANGEKLNYSRERIPDESPAQPPPASVSVTDFAFGSLTAATAWTYAAFGSGIGASNIIVAKNGAANEMYMGTYQRYWYALSHREGSSGQDEFYQSYVSTRYAARISRIRLGNVLEGSKKAILVALEDGTIVIHDQSTKQELRRFSTGVAWLTGMTSADLDGDQVDEIILCTTSALYVYSAYGVLLWQLSGVGGQDVVVGQMDSDPALEIAVSDGHVIDSGTHAVEWTWPDGFGPRLMAADIDNDGKDELIAAASWYFVWAYDVERKLPKWSIPVDLDIGAIYVADVDGDGVKELLIGEGQWGHILVYDPSTQALKWSIDNPDHGVTNIAVGDVKNDGSVKIIWGAGATSTGEDRLHVADVPTKAIEWSSICLDGPFIGPEVGDLDGDGNDEIVVASYSSSSGYDSGRILVFDSQTYRLLGISNEVAGNRGWTGIHDLKLRDVDHDGKKEILIATDYLYDGLLEIYGFDGAKFTLKASNPSKPDGAPFYSVDAVDINGDGKIEIVAGGGREHTGALGVFIYVYDYPSMTEQWHSMQMGGYWSGITGLKIADVDNDGNLEIVGMVYEDRCYIYDAKTKELKAILWGSYTDLQIDPTSRWITMSDIDGHITSFQYANGEYTAFFDHNFNMPVDGFGFYNGPAGNSLWVSSIGTLGLYGLNGVCKWKSQSHGTLFGTRVALLKNSNVAISSGSYSIVGFQFNQRLRSGESLEAIIDLLLSDSPD